MVSLSHESNIVLPLTGYDGQFGVAPAGEKGLVLYHEVMHEVSFNKRKWEVSVVDSDFNLSWSSAFESNYNFVISGVKHADPIHLSDVSGHQHPYEKLVFCAIPYRRKQHSVLSNQ
jgi:hypothetical protein